jgi:hypothetical protein
MRVNLLRKGNEGFSGALTQGPRLFFQFSVAIATKQSAALVKAISLSRLTLASHVIGTTNEP